jgi:hypothetical protein
MLHADTPRPNRLRGASIVCFGKDWSEHPTSNNHVMLELARDNRVLWLNSLATRVPNLASGRDLIKIIRKLAGFFRGARRVKENLWIYTPLVIPLPHSRWAKAINRCILRAALRVLRWRLGMGEFQLWTFLPTVADYIGTLGESLVVYYCVDEWSLFGYLDGAQVASAERELCRLADVIFASAQSLADARRELNPRTYLALHGVDHELFSRALAPETIVPDDIRNLPRPIIGFYGTLQDWVDLDLIDYLAATHPEWSIVLIGKPMVDLTKVKRHANVHLLGAKPHGALAAYCKGFSVGIVPYLPGERMTHVNPLKLREYVCAGLPVVSTPLPEVERYWEFCSVASDPRSFERAIVAALAEDSPLKRIERNHAMLAETWRARVAELGRHVMEAQRERKPDRCQAAPSSAPA